MENILQGINHICVYLDDILITEEEHLQNLDKFWPDWKIAGIHLKHDKCVFLLSAVEYPGTGQGLQPTDEKIQSIQLQKAPVPKDITQLKQFLGSINYYSRFLSNLSNTLAPLYRLLQKKAK